ncbi:hypothetical protein AY601_1646 [Pedobacter cryoconitis]|uniref:Uncharacterized protein n=1 Tax=Pedobacter cryoconitis TaxID=188932 RepID=A0A127VBL1_9SPHI|nr:hypothetical protein [Pedobacter cryoconitis]AMP98561.1 hypothetical protein AY601_1646 [Pedobacter cryoconitis]
MNYFIFTKYTTGQHSRKITFIFALLVLLFSCKKETGRQPVYAQKEVTIEYKISPYQNVITGGHIIYTDEAGVVTVADKKTLPFSRKFKTTIKRSAVLSLGIIAEYAGSVKMEILVDGQVVSALISSSIFNKREMIRYTITVPQE